MDRSGLFQRRYARPGASPGEFHPHGAGDQPRIRLIRYDAQALEELEVERVQDLRALMDPQRVSWIDVQGLGDGEVVRQLGELFELHPLAQADVVNVGQRPKADHYESALFVVLRQALPDGALGVRWEQFSLFLGDHWVLSFQERHGDCLDPLRERLRKGRSTLRASGSDYLGCMIVDAIVDGYYPVLERYGEQLEEIEEDVLENPARSVLARVYLAKRHLMEFRRATWPLRDVLGRLLRDEESREGARLDERVIPYLRDTTDHVMQVVDVVETYRELAGSFVDVYLSSIGNRTNEVMRVLTVIATIFIPLTFLAGVYGMNFDRSHAWNMPELGWPVGYALFWLVCVGVAGGLLVVFRRFGWLGSR